MNDLEYNITFIAHFEQLGDINEKGDLDYYYQGNFRPCPGIWDILERLLLLVHDDELAHNLNINKQSN